MPPFVIQQLSIRYINRSTLVQLLNTKFAAGDWAVHEDDGLFILTVPEKLSNEDISMVSVYVDRRGKAAFTRRLRRMYGSRSNAEHISYERPEVDISSKPRSEERPLGEDTPSHDRSRNPSKVPRKHNAPNTSRGVGEKINDIGSKRVPQIGQSKQPDANYVSDIPLVKSQVKAGAFIVPGVTMGDKAGVDVEITPAMYLEEGLHGVAGFSWEASQLAEGQTSSVYAVRAMFAWTSQETQRKQLPTTVKLAVKKLESDTPVEQFLLEYEALEMTRTSGHPNIIQVLQAFLLEEGGTQTFNFLFPLAAGNLKQLLRGSLDNAGIVRKTQDLWGQFEGLASAVEYLHDTCHTAHRDIKPSNILLYDDQGHPYLRAKIADFGLAMNLDGATTYSLGTIEARSAWKYDAPEIRKWAEELGVNPSWIPGPQDLVKGDIWKLGAVFAELLTFLILGSKGVKDFRNFITTTVDGLTSNALTDTRFDDGEKVKGEVLDWLCYLSKLDSRAEEITLLLKDMLSEATRRPDANSVARALRLNSFCYYLDGSRAVRFINWDRVPQPSLVDRCKERVENILQSRVYWWPLKQGLRACPSTHMRIAWNWSGKELSINVPVKDALEYRGSCVTLSQPPPYSSRGPFFNSQSSKSNQSQSTPSQQFTPSQFPQTSSPPGPSATSTTGTPPGQYSQLRELYWCIDKAWSETPQTWMSPIDVSRINDDSSLFRLLIREYNRIRGIPGRIFSWKGCHGIAFIKFYIIYSGRHRVKRVGEGLPQPPLTSGYEYSLTQSESVHMLIAAEQIIEGIRYPDRVSGLQTFFLVPKRLDPVPTWVMGVEGWGIHAVQGWSLWKVVSWFGAVTVIGMVFVVLWLIYVSKTDLQNAFIPIMFLLTMMMIVMGVPQLMNIA